MENQHHNTMSYAFPPWGYVVVDLNLDAKTLSAACAAAQRAGYQTVFREVGGAHDDAHRFQAVIGTNTNTIKRISKNITAVASVIDRNLTACQFAFMLSTSGGSDQEPHQDYTPEEVSSASRTPNSIPASAMIAIMDGTALRVYPGCFDTIDASGGKLIQIPRGQCIIFRGDLVHCGVGYAEDNYRMHCFLTLGKDNCTPETVTSAFYQQTRARTASAKA